MITLIKNVLTIKLFILYITYKYIKYACIQGFMPIQMNNPVHTSDDTLIQASISQPIINMRIGLFEIGGGLFKDPEHIYSGTVSVLDKKILYAESFEHHTNFYEYTNYSDIYNRCEKPIILTFDQNNDIDANFSHVVDMLKEVGASIMTSEGELRQVEFRIEKTDFFKDEIVTRGRLNPICLYTKEGQIVDASEFFKPSSFGTKNKWVDIIVDHDGDEYVIHLTADDQKITSPKDKKKKDDRKAFVTRPKSIHENPTSEDIDRSRVDFVNSISESQKQVYFTIMADHSNSMQGYHRPADLSAEQLKDVADDAGASTSLKRDFNDSNYYMSLIRLINKSNPAFSNKIVLVGDLFDSNVEYSKEGATVDLPSSYLRYLGLELYMEDELAPIDEVEEAILKKCDLNDVTIYCLEIGDPLIEYDQDEDEHASATALRSLINKSGGNTIDARDAGMLTKDQMSIAIMDLLAD